jgi:zinc/manganese transport system substrate-binding protein
VRTFRKLKCSAIYLLFVCLLSCQQSDNRLGEHEPLQKAGSSESQIDNKKLKVLTTIAPLYSFTKNIAGDAAGVENLLPSGTDLHEYSLSPEDIIKITRAQVIIKNGIGLEIWLDKLIPGQSSSSGKKPIIVDSASNINVINSDPHIWLSPRNAAIQVKNISEALIKADPVNSNIYRKNAADYLKRLEDLDREIMDSVGKFRKKEFVSLHSAFLYFARDYGLRQVAVIREFPDKEPTPGHIADIIKIIRAHKIKFIFSEPMVSHKVVETIARDLKLQVYSLDTLETGALYPEWYEEKMRMNLEVLKVALNS